MGIVGNCKHPSAFRKWSKLRIVLVQYGLVKSVSFRLYVLPGRCFDARCQAIRPCKSGRVSKSTAGISFYLFVTWYQTGLDYIPGKYVEAEQTRLNKVLTKSSRHCDCFPPTWQTVQRHSCYYVYRPVAPVAYQVIVEPGIGQFREFEPRRVHTRINLLGPFLVDKLTCGKRESVS